MTKPDLSVIIASCVGPPFIDRCLESLAVQRAGHNLEVLVCDRVGSTLRERLRQSYPWIEAVECAPGTSIPDLRRTGIERARADFVAVIEEHCVAAPDWIERCLAAAASGVAGTGGVVADDGYDRLTDWAVYFTEYNAYMPPLPAGDGTDVCGANCVYRREVLLRYLPECGSGYWEATLNHKLVETGETLRVDPGLVVRHTGPFPLGYYLRQRFLFSRAFAGVRRAQLPPHRRLAYLAMAPLIVPLLMARTSSRVWKKGRLRRRFLTTLPLLLPINAVYVAGEWIGYLAGPGDSLKHIE